MLTWEWIESTSNRIYDRVVLTQKDLNKPWTTANDTTDPTVDSSGSSQSPLLNTQQIISIACVGGVIVLLGELNQFLTFVLDSHYYC